MRTVKAAFAAHGFGTLTEIFVRATLETEWTAPATRVRVSGGDTLREGTIVNYRRFGRRRRCLASGTSELLRSPVTRVSWTLWGSVVSPGIDVTIGSGDREAKHPRKDRTEEVASDPCESGQAEHLGT